MFAFCDVNGYCWNAEVHCGSPSPQLPHHTTLGAIGSLTVHMLSTLKNQGFHLYLDNYYTSIKLAEFMRSSLNTSICGTMRPKRLGIPADLKEMNVAKNKFAYRRKGNVLVIKLNDKKVIYLISTHHNTEYVNTHKRDS
eukprot:scpid74734/ scgid9000/ PiggyBac transposable element-derived protein 4